MSSQVRIVGLVLFALIDVPGVCQAQMLGVGLSDSARSRLQGLSFFAVCFLACVWAFRRIWNALVADFPRLPRLSKGEATGVVALFGLMFVLIFTMISGASGLFNAEDRYIDSVRVVAAERPEEKARSEGRLEQARRDRLESLSVLLRHYANGHGGMFPADETVPEIPAEAWQLPDPSGMRYRYVAGLIAKGAVSILAYEPGIYGKQRLVLMTDGTIRSMDLRELETGLTRGAK